MARHFARSRAWRAGVAVAAATIGATALAGCGGSSSNSSAGGSSELTNETWLVPQDWGSLDPTAVAATNTGAILLVMEPLLLANADGTFSSNLATLSTPNADTYDLKLRSGATFSDGNPVTINDVAYSYQIHA